MKYTLTGLCLLLLSSIAHAAFPVEIFEYLDNIKLVAFIQEADINKSQNWTPSQGEPPLSISGVIKVTNRYTAANKNIINPLIKRIELKPVPQHAEHWHYLVMLRSETAEEKKQNRYLVVLMNGKVIPAIQEPEAYK